MPAPRSRVAPAHEGLTVPVLTSTAPPDEALRAQWAQLAKELRERRAAAASGGPERTRERHLARGKLLPRERVRRLLDPGSPFLEVAPLAACGM